MSRDTDLSGVISRFLHWRNLHHRPVDQLKAEYQRYVREHT
jgi:hypothetical protein